MKFIAFICGFQAGKWRCNGNMHLLASTGNLRP